MKSDKTKLANSKHNFILAIRTDSPTAEIGLLLDYPSHQIAHYTWEANRLLAETIHDKITEMLGKNNVEWSQIIGLIAYQGPGSFTGLRIGISVANALAYSLKIPIVGVQKNHNWLIEGCELLGENKNHYPLVPSYGAPAFVTQPRK